ncbi:probable inactive receptor kinase At4g23740 [Dendrobium catenatum]|uniref:Putative inactive receptor kinase n=1 Tax=Dendrobium catenatum TaxID=906689 RepID=A0A2I0VYE8_9ASPA|nr:probable inactive receptor kinase At4g23740 [Dendrobium catenatum]XP_020683932.2 probable inactive receptor kinase At4g23740 [Dendrobium catenatum]XP_020683933.2 probable inactive receptor kinase At4g23740 [Dendrobium catenatum]PKU68423.1 putative inactive receptor kinase [Dendrobium catenatum]
MIVRIWFSGILLLWFALSSVGFTEPVDDKRALLEFQSKIGHGFALNWKEETSMCENWKGVICDLERSRVVELRLPGIGFDGEIPPNTLSRLSALHILSLRSNGLTGPFPSALYNLSALTEIHLQLNNLSGPLPLDFFEWKNLTVLDLSYNSFNGSIPPSISNLTQLTALNLSNNSLSGHIPDLLLPNLLFFNISNNHINGSIPVSLRRFPDSSFYGNEIHPVAPASSSPFPSQLTPDVSRRKISESALLGIIIGCSSAVFVVVAIVLVICYSRNIDGTTVTMGKESKGDVSPEKTGGGNSDECKQLVFFDGTSSAFDLEDLLKASAEVLGKGTYGTVYKAVLEDATTVVVKRLKDVAVTKRELEQLMEVVGRIRHENVVDLKAYYYSKDEKLVVYEYYSQGSVYSMLHGRRNEGWTALDWESRLQIALGAARGISHIHQEHGGKLVHGNIKSTNIFLNNRNYGCISDLGLAAIVSPTIPQSPRIAGYRAPELLDVRKASQASDVYSFGVLILELLTGKSPIQITASGGEMLHLVRWVQSVVREEWTAEVFDPRLMRYPNIEEELVEMLQIAMACVAKMPEQRPNMAEVARMIEYVRKFDSSNRPSLEVRSEESKSLTPTLLQTTPDLESPMQ